MSILLKKLSIVLLLICSMACSDQIGEELIEEPNENHENPIKFLALGDSYTIGQGVNLNESWPIQLGDQLELLDFEVDSIRIIAQTGWTTTNLLQAIETSDLDSFNLVSLLIGVNNQFQNQNFSIFETEFNQLLEKSIQFAGDSSRVFVVSIPDYGVTPFGSSNAANIAQEIDTHNYYMELQCSNRNIPFINITEISRILGNSNGALASDNLHPSGSQYADWVNEILPIVTEILEK